MSVTAPARLRCVRLAFALLATVGLVPTAVRAHAFLDHAIPSVGSTVHGPPGEVRAWFTQALEPAFSNLRVVDKNRAQVDQRNSAVDPGERTLMRVSLPALPPGKYTVFWRALSIDTHTTEGSFTFEIAP